MTKIDLSSYELARLHLQAFEMTEGWGSPDEKGMWRTATVERRKELAREFVAWAVEP